MNNNDLKNVPLAGGTDSLKQQSNHSKNVLDNQVELTQHIDKLSDFMQTKFHKREWLLYPFIQQKGTAMLYAKTGIGKTFLALSMALAISVGKSFLKLVGEKPYRVLYIDGEMAADEVQERIKAISLGFGIDPFKNENLYIWTSDRQDNYVMPSLINPKGQKMVDDFLETTHIDLLIFDNLSVLCNGIRENDADSWARFQDWLLSLRRRGYSVLEIHHGGKNGDFRGNSKMQDILTYTMDLKRPDIYKKSEGARFEIHLGKTRGLCNEDIEPYEARLVEADNGGLEWIASGVRSVKSECKAAQMQQAGELSAQGKSTREVAEIMGIGKSKAANLIKEFKLSDCPPDIGDADERTDEIDLSDMPI